MYFRCYSSIKRNVRIMPYDPRHHGWGGVVIICDNQTEVANPKGSICQNVERGVLQLIKYLGYDLNTSFACAMVSRPIRFGIRAPVCRGYFRWSC